MRSFLLVVFLCLAAYSQKVELLTGGVDTQYGATVASGGVYVSNNKDMLITANKAIISKDKNNIELVGNVILKRFGITQAIVDYVNADLKNDQFFVSGVMIPAWFKSVWISAQSGMAKGNEYSLENIVSSSCEPQSPDWSIAASSGLYDADINWVHLFNPIFYAGRVPVFYLPYFGYSTDNRRHTGFLPPTFGVSNHDGFSVELPFYIAWQKWWDLEIWGQNRNNRGKGFGSRLRFVDTKHSKGEVYYGEFIDNNSYKKRYSLKDSYHKGFRAYYKSDKLFTSTNTDRLFVKWEDYSDVDYLKLENIDSKKDTIDRIITNEFNYYYSTQDYYLGLYARYYKDILDPSRDDLLQNYPNVQAHKFLSSFFLDKITYSLDLQSKQFTRKKGKTAKYQQLSIPLNFDVNFFDNFVTMSILEHFDFFNINYANDVNLTNTAAHRLNAYTKVGFSSILVKPYVDFMHILDLSVYYIKPQQIQSYGHIDTAFVNLTSELENINLKFIQYFNTKNREVFTQRVSQIYAKKKKKWEFLDLRHEIVYSPVDFVKIRNDIIYSMTNKIMLSNHTTVDFNFYPSKISVGYLEDRQDESGEKTTDYYRFKLTHSFDSRNKLESTFEYDNLLKETRRVGAKYTFSKPCWGISLDYKKETQAVTTSSGSHSRMNDIIFVSLSINPLGTYNFKAYDE